MLVAGIIVFPVLRAVVITFDPPAALASLGVGVGLDPHHVPALLAALTLAAAALGRLRGPVVPPEPYVALVVASPLPARSCSRAPCAAVSPWWHSLPPWSQSC